jgi:tetratricopeptide (TPR) repeat protein
LVLVTFAIYAPVRGYPFTGYDDLDYVTRNTTVQAGLTAAGLKWAFIGSHASNWHPLTWLSHMADCQFFGLNAGAHHLVNVALHALNSLLLFLLLRCLTGAFWRSAIVAALFAWHPTHVESVAWVAERKDVLSGLFWLLTIWAYARWVERPRPSRYAVALGLFALALLSKPMAVTLPCVLLLLDYWPLRRWQPSSTTVSSKTIAQLVTEKIPFFALALTASAVTVWAQKTGGAVTSLTRFPFDERLGNAFVSYQRYVEKLLWPTDLAVYYPHPGHWPAWRIALAVALLVVVSVLAWRNRRRFPFALTGWLWFLGTLVPVIGLVQVGSQAMADRYTYLPSIGFFVLVVWGLWEWLAAWPLRRPALGAAAAISLAGCLVFSVAQVKVWRSEFALFGHALRVTRNNFIAHGHVAGALLAEGRTQEGIDHYREAVRIFPAYHQGQINLGAALVKAGRLDEAIQHFNAFIRLQPRDPDGPFNLGVAYLQQRKFTEAIDAFSAARKLSPDSLNVHNGLGQALVAAGRHEEAVAVFTEALKLKPDATQHLQLANALGPAGRLDEAERHYTEALRLQSDLHDARFNLARLVALRGRHAEAVPLFEAYLRANPVSATAQFELATSLLQLGRREEAVAHLQTTLKLDPAHRGAREMLGKLGK